MGSRLALVNRGGEPRLEYPQRAGSAAPRREQHALGESIRERLIGERHGGAAAIGVPQENLGAPSIDAQIAARIHKSAAAAVRAQRIYRTVDGVPLGDPTEVECERREAE